jgi:hypothetical protein
MSYKHISNSDSSRETILHSINHGSFTTELLLELIHISVWLLSKKPKSSSVRVILHPVEVKKPLTIQSLVIATKISLKKIFGLLRLENEIYTNELINLFSSGEKTIYHYVYNTKDGLELKTDIGTILIQLAHKPLGSTPISWIRSYFIGIRLWKKCHIERQLLPQRFLSLKYKDLLIGDYLASYALRTESCLSLSLSRRLYSFLLEGIFICDYIWHDIEEKGSNAYVFINEVTYKQGIYRRAMHYLGVKVIDYSRSDFHSSTQFNVIYPSQYLPNVFSAIEPVVNNLSSKMKNESIKYLEGRIKQPEKYLWYMSTGYNLSNKRLLDIDEKPFELGENSGINTVIFLHSFDDAQYIFGFDGFDDLYHWTVFTLDCLLENKNVNNIFIKQHPNVNYQNYPGDKKGFEELFQRYKSKAKIKWLNKHSSLLSLLDLENVLGITHHGSVAEELVFLDIPVISSSYSPWGKYYRFSTIWNSIEEYQFLIFDLCQDKYKRPSELQKEELYKYIYNHRLNVTISDYLTAMSFHSYLEGNKTSFQEYLEFKPKLDSLTPDNPDFLSFINLLISNNLKYNISSNDSI